MVELLENVVSTYRRINPAEELHPDKINWDGVQSILNLNEKQVVVLAGDRQKYPKEMQWFANMIESNSKHICLYFPEIRFMGPIDDLLNEMGKAAYDRTGLVDPRYEHRISDAMELITDMEMQIEDWVFNHADTVLVFNVSDKSVEEIDVGDRIWELKDNSGDPAFADDPKLVELISMTNEES